MSRLAIVASHPIQYQVPWFRALAREMDVVVFFCHAQTAADQAAAGFGRDFEWDVPLLDGYEHRWLKNVARTPGVEHRTGCDTPEIRAALATGGFDACLVNGWYLKSYLQAIQACRALDIPVLVRGDSQLNGRPVWIRAVKYWPYRWLLAQVDAHLYVGRANREYLRHYGVPESRLFACPHFVDNDRFAATADRVRLTGDAARRRSALGAGDQTTVFLFAGKFIEKKRPADFVRAVAQLHRTDDVVGVLVGSGPEEPALRRLATETGARIQFVGFQNQTQMPAWYAVADCLVLPSDARETWGLVVNEGMATGLPAIVSDAAGCAPDLIESGRTGSTYPCADIGRLAQAMREFVALPPEIRARVRAWCVERVSGYTSARAVVGVQQALGAVAATSRPLGTPISEHGHG